MSVSLSPSSAALCLASLHGRAPGTNLHARGLGVSLEVPLDGITSHVPPLFTAPSTIMPLINLSAPGSALASTFCSMPLVYGLNRQAWRRPLDFFSGVSVMATQEQRHSVGLGGWPKPCGSKPVRTCFNILATIFRPLGLGFQKHFKSGQLSSPPDLRRPLWCGVGD